MINLYNYGESTPYAWPINTPMYNPGNLYSVYNMFHCPYYAYMCNSFYNQIPYYYNPYINPAAPPIKLKDYGPNPFVVDIEEAAKQNNYFRTVLWTGKYFQVTLMSINVGEDIGWEIHPNLDQFIRIEAGQGVAKMGDRKDRPDFQVNVRDDYAFIVPAGKWHNLINTGQKPLKLYSIYAPPAHPYGAVHKTKADAEEHDRH